MKRRGEKIVMVTAYDAPSGRLADAAGVDLILVGDSSGMVVHGRESTVPVTLDEILFMTQWVTRGAKRPIVVADMPFGSYETSNEQAVTNAVRLVKEGGADAVKLERGGTSVARAKAIVDAGHPGDGPRRPDAADRDGARRLQGAGAHGRPRAAARSTTRSRCRRRAASRSCSRRCRRRSRARSTQALARADDRHRRRRGHRRPGARLARHARLLRGPRAALREAVRRDRRRDRRGARPLRGARCAAARSRRSSTRTRCPRRSARSSRTA